MTGLRSLSRAMALGFFRDRTGLVRSAPEPTPTRATRLVADTESEGTSRQMKPRRKSTKMWGR